MLYEVLHTLLIELGTVMNDLPLTYQLGDLQVSEVLTLHTYYGAAG